MEVSPSRKLLAPRRSGKPPSIFSAGTRDSHPQPVRTGTERMSSSRPGSSCALCEGSNLPSCCSMCVNGRLIEYHTKLSMLRSLRDSLNSRIAARLEAQSKADDQRTWRVRKAQDIKELRDRLSELKRKTAVEKTKIKKASSDLKVQKASLNLAFFTLTKRRGDVTTMHSNDMKLAQMDLMAATSERLKMQSKFVKQLCRLFPMRRVIKEGEKKGDYSGPYDSICGVRLPCGLDPHSVPSEELSASLGYMLQLVNISVSILSAPALHVSGFGASCSRIWQRNSYWSTQQSPSKIYPLFIPHSMARHKDLQRGISLLKISVSTITTYYYNSLGFDVPSNLSTFEAFTKLLHMLSSSKALRAALESNIASRSAEQAQHLNGSIWKASSAISSESSILDSTHTVIMSSSLDNLPLNSNGSFLYTGQPPKQHDDVPESISDGWDLVEREVLPPPPSQVEDIAHWERAMFAGAKRKK